jgi:seryl-tRNA synthetase
MKKEDFEKLSPEEQAAVREKKREYNRQHQAARRAKKKAGEKPGKRGLKKKEAPEAGAEAAMPFLESLLGIPKKIAALETELKELLLDFEEVLRDNRQMKDFFKYGKKPEWGKA